MDEKRLRIAGVRAEETSDSRGNPAVRTVLTLENGMTGIASVPSDSPSAIENVNTLIAPALAGVPVTDQTRIDSLMIALGGTENRSTFGAPVTLSVSLAACRAAAKVKKEPLYRYIGGPFAAALPVPMMTLISGGDEDGSRLHMSEFLIVPVGAPSFSEGLRCGARISRSLRKILKKQGYAPFPGNEAEDVPSLSSGKEALDLLLRAAKAAGYVPGEDVTVTSFASTCIRNPNHTVFLSKSKVNFTKYVTAEYYLKLAAGYSGFSFEAKISENSACGGLASVAVVPERAGTVTRIADTVAAVKRAGLRVILSHARAAMDDSTLADLAVGLGADFVKGGIPAGEDTADFCRLREIERELFRPDYGSFSS